MPEANTTMMDSGIDEQLLAGRMREAKNRAKNGTAGEEEPEAGAEAASLRQRVMAARQALDIKKRAAEKLKEKVMAPLKMGTSRLLQWAWGVLIPSWGLSLLYINMHVFLRWVFPSAFCKLGEEWLPKIVTGHSKDNIAGTSFGIVEIIALFFLDLIAAMIIIAILAFIVMIATWLGASWTERLGMIWDLMKSLGWATMSALQGLFK